MDPSKVDTIIISTVDYDGAGDVTEGLAGEVATLREVLYGAIKAYAADRSGAAIINDSHAYAASSSTQTPTGSRIRARASIPISTLPGRQPF